MGPRQSLLLLLSIIQSGMNRIGVRPEKLVLMRDLTGSCGWAGDAVPSAGAMCKALRKLTPAMWESLIQLGLLELNRTAGPVWLIHRRRLVAIDGVRINARRGSILARWLGLPKQGDGRKAHQPQALVIIARCVESGVTLDQEIVKHIRTTPGRMVADRMATREKSAHQVRALQSARHHHPQRPRPSLQT